MYLNSFCYIKEMILKIGLLNFGTRHHYNLIFKHVLIPDVVAKNSLVYWLFKSREYGEN